MHGYHVETELIGTKGMLRIGNAPEKILSHFTTVMVSYDLLLIIFLNALEKHS
ncbi:hypothetical protein [Staphylococcus delphini]|uniref:hypothetical protein n=1 Tax=Staphylococcus delphini TaxID=53344 RepID=UPI001F5BFFC4|nr:hypothetical protein [Staphylococcus delphini]